MAIDFEDVACLLCGGRDAADSDTITWRDTAMHYVICRSCGLKYMRPRPTREWYLKFYQREFWQEKVQFKGYSPKGSRRPLPLTKGLAKRIAKQGWRAQRIHELVSQHVPLDADSLVLDIGAAFGVTLHQLRERYGCRVLGVEPSDLSREYAQREHNIEFVGRAMEDLLGPQPFDGQVTLMIMSHVLENMVDPREALQNVRRLLRTEGFLYIDMCNFYYNNAVNPYHPYVFSPQTLEELLAQTGFRITTARHEPHPSAVQEPTDPYLAIIAQPGQASFIRPPVDVKQMVHDQALGISKLQDAEEKKRRKPPRPPVRPHSPL